MTILTNLQETWELPAPPVIFFDAMGTLFGLRASVGEIYAAIAARHGIVADPEQLNLVFGEVFAQAPPLALGSQEAVSLTTAEEQWWRTLVTQVFAQAEIALGEEFADFFQDLYGYFAKPDPWRVYEDVIPTLQHWQQQGVMLGVLSNFDSRLLGVLDSLELGSYFTRVIVSSKYPWAKPQGQLFQAALACWDVEPQRVWHIGDSLQEDYQGAQTAGWQAFLIQRSTTKKALPLRKS
jgi:putative hydrolase of the HAD superfamily